MKTNSDSVLPKLQDLGNGRFYYNFNQIEVVKNNVNDGPDVTVNECDTVIIEDTPSYDKIVNAVIRSQYTSSKEISLINNYLAAKEDAGVLDENPDIEEYLNYQSDRRAIKDMVKADCIEIGISID